MTGEPSYLELGVPDVDRALAFYGAVLGWAVDPAAGMTEVRTPTLNVGIHGGDPTAHFEVLFRVPDLDAALTAVGAGGGEVLGKVDESPDSRSSGRAATSWSISASGGGRRGTTTSA